VDYGLLRALAEPNRLRIIELLGESPRPVGEIATRLAVRQPQVTKHLQTLERTGLVEVHPLGRRRIYALRRERLRELRDWLSGFEPTHPSEGVLVQYRAAIEAEQALSDQQRRTPRTFQFERELPAPPSRVWQAWTTATIVHR
jgi:DNA-binding transcriptional ArsR family regulator